MRLPILLLGLCGTAAASTVPVQGYEIVRTYSHDPAAYTQGLFFHKGAFYESTGIEGQSSLRQVRLADGRVLRKVPIADTEFGEGSTGWGNDIVSVTWKNGIGYRWDRKSLKLRSSFRYPGEGWGLTHNGRDLVLSDGTPWLRFLDPVTFKERRRVQVTADGQPVHDLNELEWVKGEVYANIWQTNRIARIDPATGAVTAWIDLSGLDRLAGAEGRDDVLNGIAWEPRQGRLFVTGKRWPKLFEIKLKAAN